LVLEGAVELPLGVELPLEIVDGLLCGTDLAAGVAVLDGLTLEFVLCAGLVVAELLPLVFETLVR